MLNMFNICKATQPSVPVFLKGFASFKRPLRTNFPHTPAQPLMCFVTLDALEQHAHRHPRAGKAGRAGKNAGAGDDRVWFMVSLSGGEHSFTVQVDAFVRKPLTEAILGLLYFRRQGANERQRTCGRPP